MIDGLIASKIARMEHEERVRALVREEQWLNDILPDEYDTWVTSAAGQGHIPFVGDLLSSLGNGLNALGDRLKRKAESPLHEPLSGQKRRTMVG